MKNRNKFRIGAVALLFGATTISSYALGSRVWEGTQNNLNSKDYIVEIGLKNQASKENQEKMLKAIGTLENELEEEMTFSDGLLVTIEGRDAVIAERDQLLRDQELEIKALEKELKEKGNVELGYALEEAKEIESLLKELAGN